MDVKRPQVKQNLWLFINCQIENPAFSSQTKELMTSHARNFGSECNLPESLFKSVLKSPIVESVVLNFEARQNAQLKRALGTGKKKEKLFDIPKLEDANWAGKRDCAHKCTLIITEGDSAKALAMAGI